MSEATNATGSTKFDLPVPLVAVDRENGPLEAEFRAAAERVLASGAFILGPEVKAFEEAAARYCGVKHAIGCASGSDALLLALLALDVGPGDEVILPSFTFFATAGAVVRVGATPVFADIELDSFNLDMADVAARITPRTKAILPVHLYGQAADLGSLRALGARPRLAIVEDACQAIGAEFDGRRVGGIGEIGCFSFYPTKNLGGAGDGGLVTTQDDSLADKLRLFRVHGMQPRYHHRVVGVNSRLDSLQAAILNVKLPHLERYTELRRANAARYHEMFVAAGLADALGLPRELPRRRHVWNQFVIRVPEGRRDALRQALSEARIGTEIYYPIPVHQQECFAGCDFAQVSLPKTEQACREALALPIFPLLTAAEQERVVSQIGAFLRPAGRGVPAPKFREASRSSRVG